MNQAQSDLYQALRDALMFNPARQLDYPRLTKPWTAADAVDDDCAGDGTRMVALLRVVARAAKNGDPEAVAIIDGICQRYAHAHETERADDLIEEARETEGRRIA